MKSVDCDLLVNVYERTYRSALSETVIGGIVTSNLVAFRSVHVLINNVEDRGDAARRAEALVRSGTLSGYSHVAVELPRALAATGLSRRALGRRPYFLDYGLVMGVVGEAAHVVGWDAEVTLVQETDWITGAEALLRDDQSVFSCSPRWPTGGFDTLAEETVATSGRWALNWGFSDQAFMVRRAELASPIYRAFAPAALARHARHPRTFEARMEAYQRAARRWRATARDAEYIHNDLGAVLTRLGDERAGEVVTRKVLGGVRRVLTRAAFDAPRLRLP